MPAKTPDKALSYDDVLRIIELVKTTQFHEFRLKLGEVEVHLRRNNASMVPAVAPALAPAAWPEGTPAPVQAPAPAQVQAPGAAQEFPEGAHVVRSPMVGTFYRAPEPGAKPFVEVGGEVSPETTLGIIEVMKLMNSIPAGVRGVVSAVLVENAQYVEYGQPLVVIDPRP